MNEESLKLINLPEETRNLLMNGPWQCFRMSKSDSSYPLARFLLVTDRDYKFLLSWQGDVLFHSSEYTLPKDVTLLREHGFLKNHPILLRKVV